MSEIISALLCNPRINLLNFHLECLRNKSTKFADIVLSNFAITAVCRSMKEDVTELARFTLIHL